MPYFSNKYKQPIIGISEFVLEQYQTYDIYG